MTLYGIRNSTEQDGGHFHRGEYENFKKINISRGI